jgi:hypothetical protein
MLTFMRRVRAGLAGLLTLVTCVVGCRRADYVNHIHQDDLILLAPGVAQFDANNIVNAATLTDASSFDVTYIEGFLRSSPYGSPSFLSTYTSNGVSAADAIISAAQRHQINPIAILTRAQMNQGLVSASRYPSDGSRIEYVFGCGCRAPGDCDPAFAGFDIQVECFAYALRSSLNAIAADGRTAGGWGPGIAGQTLDGNTVTPTDAGTAAIYQYDPTVGTFATGSSLFWTVFSNYAHALGYFGPPDPAIAGAWLGDACAKDGNCGYPNPICADNYPGGMCTLACTGSCPDQPGKAAAFCGAFDNQGYCLRVCNELAPSCRDGYACRKVKRFPTTSASQAGCVPQ